jgi:hypothetical protein
VMAGATAAAAAAALQQPAAEPLSNSAVLSRESLMAMATPYS